MIQSFLRIQISIFLLLPSFKSFLLLLLTLPAPHELPPREMLEYQRHYLIVNHIGALRAEHDDLTIRFASSMNQLLLLKSNDGAYTEWCREVKGNMYDMVVEGFQLLSRWTARIWEQSAWKFSRPCRDPAETQEALWIIF